MPLYRPAIIPSKTAQLLYELLGANMNTTADQVFTKLHSGEAYQIQSIIAYNPSLSLTAAVGGIYPAAAKAGNALVSAGQAYSALNTAAATAGTALPLQLHGRGKLAITPILALSTPQGAAATCDIIINGWLR